MGSGAEGGERNEGWATHDMRANAASGKLEPAARQEVQTWNGDGHKCFFPGQCSAEQKGGG